MGMGFPSWTTWLLTFNGAGSDMAIPPDVSHYASRSPDARARSVTTRGSRSGWRPAVRRLRRRARPGGPRSARAPPRAARLGAPAPSEALALRALHDTRGHRGHGHRRDGVRGERVLHRG